MSAEQIMELARRFLEAHVKGDVDAVDEMLASDFVSHTKLFPCFPTKRPTAKA